MDAAVGADAGIRVYDDGSAVRDAEAGTEHVGRNVEPAAHGLGMEADGPVLVDKLPEQPVVLATVQVIFHTAQQALELPDLIEHHLRRVGAAQGDPVRFAVGQQI